MRAREAVGQPEDAALMVRRLRFGCAAAGWTAVGLAVGDLVMYRRQLAVLWTLRLAEIALMLLVRSLICRPSVARHGRRTALLAYTGLCGLAAIAGAVIGDAQSTALILATLAAGASIVLPWGGTVQMIAAAVTALALAASVLGSGNSLLAMFPHPNAAVLALLVVSVYVAYELEQQRRAVAERDQSLRETTRWHDALIEALPVTLFRIVLHGEHAGGMWCSDNVERMTGFPSGRFGTGDGIAFWSSRVHADDQEIYVGSMQTMARHRISSIEYRWQHADGAFRWLLSQAVLLRGPRGEMLEVIGSISDVSAPKRAAAALREHDLRSRLVAHATNDALWDWDLITDRLEWNDAVYTLFAYPVRAVGETIDWWIERIHPDDRDRVVTGIRSVIDEGGQAWADEYRWRRHDGSYAHVTDRGYVMREETGRPVRMIGAMTDCSLRKAAEEALRQSETYYRSLIEKGSDLIGVVNNDGTMRYVSPSHRRMLGYKPEQLIGRSSLDLVHPEDLGAMAERFGGLAHVGEAPAEFRFRHADGSWRILQSSIIDLTADPAISGIVVTSRDVTDRRLAEAELQRAKETAETASRAKSEFVANMSHEIRTPLNGIVGMAQLLADTGLDAEQREYVELMQSSADWLLGVINDVLDFSKIEAGKISIEHRAFAPREMLADTMRVLASRGQAKGLQVVWSVDEAVPPVLLGDGGRVRQILVNLVSNAIKFTEHGEVRASVGCDPMPTEPASDRRPGAATGRPDGAIELHLRVADTGIGIPVEKHTAVFEAFEQADGSTTRRYGGTGLGLAICKRLVTLLGGRIWVDSEPGQGSTFHFTARCAVAEDERIAEDARLKSAPRARRSVGGGGPAAPVPRGGLHVLLAEDNAVNQRLAVRLLEKAGHTVVVAGDGRAALTALSHERFDLVLMDVQMPEMGGFEATEAIRADERISGAHLPIIAMTAHAMAGDRERCLAVGMDGYVSKPVRQQELLAAIDAVLSTGESDRSVAAEPSAVAS